MRERNPENNQLESMLTDYQRLREENAAFRRLLAEHGISIPAEPKNHPWPALKPTPQDAGVNEHSGKDAKLALFRGSLRGRDDIYAVRKLFKSGEWGYVPASIRDWKAVLSADAAIRKKIDQRTRKLLPLTDDVLRQHLEGKQTIGVYPLLLDETCWFLTVDLDKKNWQEDAVAFLETCQDLGVLSALERSRSGNGGHVWIFFERDPSFSRAKTREPDPHENHGSTPPTWDGLVRPLLSEPGHPAEGRLRKSYRPAPAVESPAERQQRISGFILPSMF